MAISMQKARTLCTKSELDLIKWSSPSMSKTLSSKQLRQKVDRARKLRDKFKDLSRKQAGEARGKRKPTGTRAAKGNDRTVEKRELFDEAIARFEQALTKAEASEKKAEQAKDKAKAAKAKTKKKSTAKKAAAKKTSAKKSSSKKTTSKASGAKATAGDGALPAAPPKSRARNAVTSLSLAGSGGASPFSLGSSGSMQASRETRRQQASKSSKIGREQSRFARTAQEKIQGHVSASTRRSQAKRDSK